MRSRDVMELFDDTPVGTPVEILADRFPHFQRAQPKTELFASNDSITTVMGPHGMVIVKTVRPGEPPSVAKDKVASALTLFADAKSPAPAVPQSLPEKPSEPAAKPLAKTTAPPPIAVGPTVVLRPPPPAEPRVVLYAMNGSILDSDMPKSAKPAVPAPVAAKPVSPPEAQVAAVPRESQVPATEPDAPRNLVLQVTEPIDLLASPKEAASQAPLDQLSTHLLNPPAPPFRLAFRTAAATPDL
jgi:hypothetical protein